jgi:AraC-like DNA-binding protein
MPVNGQLIHWEGIGLPRCSLNGWARRQLFVDATFWQERRRSFRSRNLDEAHAYLQGVGLRLEVSSERASEIDLHVNGFYLAGSYIGRVKYGPAVTVVAADGGRDDFWLHIPVRGTFEVTNCRGSVACAPDQEGVLSGPAGHLTRSHAGSERITLVVPRSTMEIQLAMLLGDAPREALEFAPKIDLASGHGLSLTRYLRMAIADLERPGSMLHQPAVRGIFEQFMMTGLLLSQPNNHSEALGRGGRPIVPRDMRRAIDYIEAHLDTAFKTADVIKATGIAGRTLFKHFKDFKGISPMRYAQNARFREVRRSLLQAEPEEGVTDIAMRWGFTHMGRFSIEYRLRYGESPSQTLKRRRGGR